METSSKIENRTEWWEDSGGFFGQQYMLGDDSIEGYLPGKRESLEERTRREVDGIVKLLKLRGNEYILDVPCGYGRHSIELARKGYMVEGFDINQEHIKGAQKRVFEIFSEMKGCPNIPIFSFVDMRDLDKFEYVCVDVVVNMFYSFGFFETDEENESVMRGFYKQLKDGGRLLLHTDVSPEMIMQGKNYRLNEQRNLGNGKKLRIDETYCPKTKRINGTWTITNGDGITNRLTPYSVRIYSEKEFRDLAKRCGFRDVNIYGSFNGENFAPDSKEMIIVAKK